MKYLPDRHEALALAAVWLTWPALRLSHIAFQAAQSDMLMGAISWHKQLGMELLRSNLRCLPSLIGSVVVVIVARFVSKEELKKTAFHATTLGAFGFVVGVQGLLFI